ncbi:MAG: Nif3-like dinuclear metal center hexameric protein [Acidobacteria bacterium]|nr:Nif3-like dinuclear metal center hexameric protein [Acidobacteriota bacterium]
MSRREFGQGAGAALLLSGGVSRALGTAPSHLSAEDVVKRIAHKMAADGIPWESKFPWKPTDGFKYGDPTTRVTGIVFTFQATFEVLKKAVEAKKNMVISHERMFWDHLDDVGTMKHDKPFEVAVSLETDPVFVAKRRYCEENGLVVWRFHDHQHMLNPDPILTGLTAKLGWQNNTVPVQGQMVGTAYVIPETPLKDVARHVASSLGSRNVRVIGDPDLPVKRVGIGAHKLIEILKPLQTCDVVLMSEPQDCDAFPYLRDGISLGLPHPKGLIAITHERFEEFGEEIAPGWLQPLVPEIPVEFISAGDPYWILPWKAV